MVDAVVHELERSDRREGAEPRDEGVAGVGSRRQVDRPSLRLCQVLAKPGPRAPASARSSAGLPDTTCVMFT